LPHLAHNYLLSIPCIAWRRGKIHQHQQRAFRVVTMAQRDVRFSIDRGGTFTDIFAEVTILFLSSTASDLPHLA